MDRGRQASLPWILGHCPLGLDFLEYRRFLKMHPDIVGDEHQQEREQERDAPAPVVERGLAEIGACCDDDEERQYDSEGGRGLQPASVVPGLGDYASSCGSWSLYSAIGNIPMALSEAIIATAALAPAGRTPTVLGNSGRRLVGARYAIIAARGPAHRAPLAGLSRLR